MLATCASLSQTSSHRFGGWLVGWLVLGGVGWLGCLGGAVAGCGLGWWLAVAACEWAVAGLQLACGGAVAACGSADLGCALHFSKPGFHFLVSLSSLAIYKNVLLNFQISEQKCTLEFSQLSFNVFSKKPWRFAIL